VGGTKDTGASVAKFCESVPKLGIGLDAEGYCKGECGISMDKREGWGNFSRTNVPGDRRTELVKNSEASLAVSTGVGTLRWAKAYGERASLG